MAEIYFVDKKQDINYEGVLNINELYMTMDQWFKEKGYDKLELKNEEIIQKEGKYIELLLEPWKKITDYTKLVIRVHARIYDCKDVEVEIDNHKLNMNRARVQIQTESFMITDYQDRFDTHPIYYFIRTLFDKFFFRIYTTKHVGELSEHTADLRAHIKSFLNLHRFQTEK